MISKRLRVVFLPIILKYRWKKCVFSMIICLQTIERTLFIISGFFQKMPLIFGSPSQLESSLSDESCLASWSIIQLWIHLILLEPRNFSNEHYMHLEAVSQVLRAHISSLVNSMQCEILSHLLSKYFHLCSPSDFLVIYITSNEI